MAVNEHEGGVRHRRTQAERSAGTRSALIAAARRLFAADGFAATGREDIVEAAGVTRGALYHHFATKEDLFRAVYEELEREIVAGVAGAAAAAVDPMGQLRAGAQAFLDIAMDPAIQRVCLIDAPAVLGWETRQAIIDEYGLGLVRGALHAAVATGSIEPQPVDALAHLLLAALEEAALLIARAADPDAARREVGATVDRLLAALV